MSFPYVRGVPNPPNNPSQDVGSMQNNTNTIDDWVKVDHIGFRESSGGHHKQVVFQVNATPPPPVGVVSQEFTAPGIAKPATSQLFFQNPDKIFPLSGVRAFATFDCGTSNGGKTINNGYNITTINRSSVSQVDITMPSGVVIGTDYLIFIQSGGFDTSPFYNGVTSTGFSILTGGSSFNNATISFLVIQI